MEKTQIYKKNNLFRPTLTITEPEGQPRKVSLNDRMTMGRPTLKNSPDIPLYAMFVSRVHGEFGIVGENCFYRDLGSRYGTWLNGNICQETVQLKNGDVLSIRTGHYPDPAREIRIEYSETRAAETEKQFSSVAEKIKFGIWDKNGACMKMCDTEQSEQCDKKAPRMTDRISDNRLQIQIEKREVRIGFRKKTLLKDIHLQVSSGEMVLILGGSGAGKTTFINAVMGYEEADGKILFDGRNVYEEYEQMKYEIAYVPQQDLVRGTDTVWGTLCNAAQMRMPASAELYDKMHHAEEVLELFGLERERDTLVSKLSGGQRKRLSIAGEYIGNPTLFFLDEPDSGLDGVMARSLMENLREIGDMGKIVMVITHAPDRAADLFDKVLVLAKSEEDDAGHLAFYGTAAEARSFFETDTLEGIVKRINRHDEGGDGLADRYIQKFREKCR